MSPQLQFAVGMVGSVLVLVTGLLGVVVLADDALQPLAWMFLVIGLLAVLGNLIVRQRLE